MTNGDVSGRDGVSGNAHSITLSLSAH
jgi:hypothetical protein